MSVPIEKNKENEGACDVSSSFKLNDYYESLFTMREVNRKAFDTLSPATHLALSYYERAKHQACLNER
jgi:hypothetical protein